MKTHINSIFPCPPSLPPTQLKPAVSFQWGTYKNKATGIIIHFSISLKLTIVLAMIGPKAWIHCLLLDQRTLYVVTCVCLLSSPPSLQGTLESGLSQTLMHFIRPYDN